VSDRSESEASSQTENINIRNQTPFLPVRENVGDIFV
jgi:hypothetical protein